MARALLIVLVVAVVVFALTDCLQTNRSQLRTLTKPAWLFLIIFVPLVGAMAYLSFETWSRPAPPQSNDDWTPRRGPLAPDDNPDFLRTVEKQLRDDKKPDDQGD